jgi:hypothetical protein
MSYSSSQSQLTLESPIREALDRCRSKLRAEEELEEIDNIAQWINRATMRPLFLSEICSALGLLAPSREDETALGQDRTRTTCTQPLQPNLQACEEQPCIVRDHRRPVAGVAPTAFPIHTCEHAGGVHTPSTLIML